MPKPFELTPKQPKANEGEDTFRFQCRAYKLPRVEEQYHFALPMGRKFAADFAFVDYKLLVEIKGGIWRPGGGAHSRPSNLDRDIEREQYAVLLGFYVLPFTPDDVQNGHAIDWTQRVLHRHGWRP